MNQETKSSPGFHGYPTRLKKLAAVLFIGCSSLAYAGGEFDYVGYSAPFLLQAVAKEFDLDSKVNIQRTKSDYCRVIGPKCRSLEVTVPLDRQGLLERSIFALSKPCEYARRTPFKIKNPVLSTAKEMPSIDAVDFFCRKPSVDETIILIVHDFSRNLGTTPFVLIIRRSEHVNVAG